MCGEHNGLKKLISEECQRYVLCLHCFLHRISLVVIHVMENITEIKEYFDIISSLYQFLKKSAVLNMYEGTQLKRLIATRWSGHFDSTSHVNKNYGQIIKALHLACKNKKLKSEERALAIGLVNQMAGGEGDDSFVFLNCLLMEILTPINIVVKTLQSSHENLHSAIQVVNAVREDLRSTRFSLNEELITKMIAEFKEKNQIPLDNSKQKRKTSVPTHFQDFVITDPIPADSSDSYVQTFKECIDVLESEFQRRFSNDNVTLWHSMESLSPNSEKLIDAESLKPLFEYAKTIPVLRREYSRLNVSIEDLKGECRIFSRVLRNKEFSKDENGVIDLVEVGSHLIEKHKESAPILGSLYKVPITAGFSSTRVDCLFSSLTMIDTPQRRSMLTERENASWLI